MERQTRANLIFLIVFLALSLPGAVILFKKKLDPSAPRLDMPDAVTHRLPYLTPLPVPPGMKWIVPDRTFQWLKNLSQQTATTQPYSAAPPGPEWEPVISPDHRLQVLTLSGKQLELMIWEADLEPKPRLFAVKADETAAQVSAVSEEPVPQEVRRELVQLGYTKPPKNVMLLKATLPVPLAVGLKVSISVSYSGPPAAVSSSAELVVR